MSADSEEHKTLFSVGDIAVYAHSEESSKDSRREFVRIEAVDEKESKAFYTVRTVWGGAEKETTSDRLLRIELPRVRGASSLETVANLGAEENLVSDQKSPGKQGTADIDVGDYAIGIDVGTSYFSAATWRNDHVEIIPNEYDDRITPAVIAFGDEERVIGSGAKDFASLNATNTIFDIKRLIGRYFDDPAVQSEISRWPFRVIRGVDNRPLVQVTYRGAMQTFYPEEIYAMQLAKIKESAEAYLGGKVVQAVITVPANFCEAQRQATRDAAVIAGFQVLRLVSEPTAAAIAYGLERKGEEQTIIVVDIGGGAADVSLLTIEDGIFEVKATAGDTCFGGVDFDERLVEHCLKDYEALYGINVRSDVRAVQRLRIACEHAKRTLSERDHANIELEDFHSGRDYATTITRAKFEELNADYFQRILEPIQKVLKDTKTLKEEIDDVVLVGGSTRIPKIQQLLSEFFHNKALNTSLNPDEAGAYGAAIQAAILSGHDGSSQLEDFLLLDVVPYSIAIETFNAEGEGYETIIQQHSTIPAKKQITFATAEEGQTSVFVKVLEVDAAQNKRLLGQFRYDGITPRQAGSSLVEAEFNLDADDHLRIVIGEIPCGEEDMKVFSVGSSFQRSSGEIQQMIARAERMNADETEARARDAAKCRLEKYVNRMEEYLTAQGSVLPPDTKQALETKTLQLQQWLRESGSGNAGPFDFERELDAFEALVDKELRSQTQHSDTVFHFAPPSPLKKKNKSY